MNEIEKINKLIQKADEVIRSHQPNPPGVIGFPTLDSKLFLSWQSQCINFLEKLFSKDNIYTQKFNDTITQAYIGTVESGKGILMAVRDDILDGVLNENVTIENAPVLEKIKIISERFHVVTKQFHSRVNSKDTLEVITEDDTQNLFNALLLLFFEDIRKEEWIPSYSVNGPRKDFLLMEDGVVIQVKKTRNGLGEKELGKQLFEDIARYKDHQVCSILFCFIYDPEGIIVNPRQIENDLSKRINHIEVIVSIRP